LPVSGLPGKNTVSMIQVTHGTSPEFHDALGSSRDLCIHDVPGPVGSLTRSGAATELLSRYQVVLAQFDSVCGDLGSFNGAPFRMARPNN
jgi:hypothetical protein